MYPILYISPESSRAWVLGLRSWGLHVYDVVSICISLVFLFLLCVHHCINYNINYAKCHIYSAQAWSLEAMSHVYSWTALETFWVFWARLFHTAFLITIKYYTLIWSLSISWIVCCTHVHVCFKNKYFWREGGAWVMSSPSSWGSFFMNVK